MAEIDCNNCNYFAETDNPDWNGIHCCFREWRHRDEEIAPCDEDDFDYDNEEIYDV